MRRIVTRRFQWPRGIKRELPAARFLGLRVRNAQGYGCLSLVRVVCCEVEVSAMGRFLGQKCPTECVTIKYHQALQ